MFYPFSGSLVLIALSLAVNAAPSTSCVSMDSYWNLLAFNLGGKDFNAGTRDNWTSGSPKELSTVGKPPYSGESVTCYLSQFSNAVYITGSDSSNPNDIYIYDASDDSWSTQSVGAPDGFDPSSLVAILDHDTNIYYGLSQGKLYSLPMGDTLSKATSELISWQDVSTPPWMSEGYEPVMALAKNHIHFLNAPNAAAGSADIFVIHFSYWQPEIQEYGKFPATHGQAVSMFLDQGAQLEFAFVPNSAENTYIVNVETNTTTMFPGPSMKDAQASYFGSPDTLVQLTSSGAVNYMPYSNSPDAGNIAWSAVEVLVNAAPPSTTSTTSTASAIQVNSTDAPSNNSPHISVAVGGSFYIALAALVPLASYGGLLFL